MTVTVTNGGTTKLSRLSVTFTGPVGWSVYPESRIVRDAVRPGQSVQVSFDIRVPEKLPGFTLRTFTATASYPVAVRPGPGSSVPASRCRTWPRRTTTSV